MTIAFEAQQYYDHARIKWGDEVSFPNTRSITQYTHRIYNRYPARSISLVPRAILKALRSQSHTHRPLRVLDPFMGSGTTAVESVLQGMQPFGVELDPFARLISEVRVRPYRDDELRRLRTTFLQIASTWRDFPPDENLAPDLENISYWFDDNTFARLLQLKNAIYTLARTHAADLDFLRIVLADIIRPVSKAERQTLKPYISKKYEKQPADVGAAFVKSFEAHYAALAEYSQVISLTAPPITWLGANGTDFKTSRVKMDVAITSPPYINALDYVRCIKIESAWVGTGSDIVFSELRKSQVGDPSRGSKQVDPIVCRRLHKIVVEIEKVDPNRAATILGYFQDMLHNLKSVYAALRPGGEYHIILGDSVIRDVAIPTHCLLAELGKASGFEWVNYYYYKIKDHRTSIPRNGQGGKIEIEHVISLRKPEHHNGNS